MIDLSLIHALRHQICGEDGPIGFCAAFAGLTWGTLTGGLLGTSLETILAAGGSGMLVATSGFAAREIMLARAAISHPGR